MSNDKRLLKLINEVSRAATSILNVNLMLTTVTQAIQQSFGFYRVGVFRLHSEQKNSLLSDSTGKDGRSFHKEIAVEQADPLIIKALEQGKTVVIEDIDVWRRDGKLKPHNSSDFFAQGVSSCLIIPLKLGVKIIGVLTLECAELDIFGPSLTAAMETLSDQLAVAIENARLYNELNTNVNELLALNRITQSVSSTLDFQETLTLLAAHVTSMLNVAATSVVWRDDETAEVWFAAAVGQGAAAVLGKRMSLGQGIAGWVAQEGAPLIVPNVHQDSRFYPEMDAQISFKTRAILCVPLQSKGRLIGAVEAINKRDGQFTEQDLNRLVALSAPAATAIENAQLYQNLARQMAQVDTLRAFNQNVIENMTTGLIALDIAGLVTVFNKAASALLGLRTEEIIGQPATVALTRAPELIAPLTTALKTRQRLDERNVIIQHWDGSLITIAVTTTPMYTAEGEFTGVLGLIEDLTALKTLEAESRRLDRLADLGEMSAIVAHELRNPIAGIAVGVNYLTKKIAQDTTDYQAGQMILKEVDRVQRIIEDILLVARPLDLQKESHSLPEIINAVEQEYQAALREKQVMLKITLAEHLPEIVVDRGRIEQVFSNLIENAIHAMPEGGVINISARNLPAKGMVAVRLNDTGHGILTSNQQTIFEPFTTTKNRGAGLGLALSRRILEAHNGSIHIAASDQTGATFEIRLPVRAE